MLSPTSTVNRLASLNPFTIASSRVQPRLLCFCDAASSDEIFDCLISDDAILNGTRIENVETT